MLTFFDGGRRQATSDAAVAEAQRGVQIFTNRYQAGADPDLEVVSAQTIALLNERNEVDILRRHMEATVLLIKAFGGGWNVSKLPQVSSHALIPSRISCQLRNTARRA